MATEMRTASHLVPYSTGAKPAGRVDDRGFVTR
jgi:hypothetical protein